MMIFYIDEAGTNRSKNYLILTAVSIHYNNHWLIDRQVNEHKRNLVPWAKPEDWEIKTNELYHGMNFFGRFDRELRNKAIRETARLIKQLPCYILAIQLDKNRVLSRQIGYNEMYRLGFWGLLDLIKDYLIKSQKIGLMLVDSRSTQSSSVQDRRLIDAYREWHSFRNIADHNLIGLPWFGFSAFYGGLQLSDFCSYLISINKIRMR